MYYENTQSSALNDVSQPVSLYDTTPHACAERLGRLLGSQPLTLAARGGGLIEEKSVYLQHVFLIDRNELEGIVRFLNELSYLQSQPAST